MRRNKEDSRIKRSLISRFKRRNQEDFIREILKRFFKKTNIAQFCFSKEFFSKFSKLPEFLLFGNRLPVFCNRLPVTKFDFKSF